MKAINSPLGYTAAAAALIAAARALQRQRPRVPFAPLPTRSDGEILPWSDPNPLFESLLADSVDESMHHTDLAMRHIDDAAFCGMCGASTDGIKADILDVIARQRQEIESHFSMLHATELAWLSLIDGLRVRAAEGDEGAAAFIRAWLDKSSWLASEDGPIDVLALNERLFRPPTTQFARLCPVSACQGLGLPSTSHSEPSVPSQLVAKFQEALATNE